MKEFRVEIKVRNNTFLSKLEKAGYKTVGEFCRINQIAASTLWDFINLKKSPLREDGDFCTVIHKTAELLGCAPEDLFSESQLHLELQSNKRSIEVSDAEMKFMIENTQNEQMLLEDIVSEEKKNEELYRQIGTLTPREMKVISMRYGLGDYSNAHTLEEVGLEFDLSRQRVRQIECKALRKLRHPSRADSLREFETY